MIKRGLKTFINKEDALNYINKYLMQNKAKSIPCNIINCAKRLYNQGKISQLLLMEIETEFKGLE